MAITIDANFYKNLLSSVEAFLYTNVVLPYNTAVQGTNYVDELHIIQPPQDQGTVAYVPVIVLPDDFYDYHDYESLGMGDHEGWLFKQFDLEVYPGVQTDTDGAQKSSQKAAAILRSLFDTVSTGLTMPFYDYTNPASPVQIGGMYFTGRTKRLHGAITTIALHRNRFDYELQVQVNVASLTA